MPRVPSPHALTRCLLLAALGLGVGCKASLQLSPVQGDDSSGGQVKVNNKNPVKPNDPTRPPVIDPDLCAQQGQCGQERPGSGLRLIRLTHEQWAGATRDLLRLEAPPAQARDFYKDPAGAGFFSNDGQVLEVTNQLWAHYREASEQLAAQAASSGARINALLKEGSPAGGVEQARALAQQVGLRAWRRPLTQAEVDALLALYARAPEMFNDGDMHRRGVELILRALIQSPHYIYRAELGASQLDGYERAAKLALTLWRSGPDEALLEAAASGQLDSPEGVAQQARRMLEDARAQDTVLDFFGQIYKLPSLDKLEKDAQRFPEFKPATARAMRQELERFVVDAVFTRDRGLEELLTSRRSFVNRELAALYGLPGEFGAELTEVELPAQERAGLLTRLGFLAYNATAYEQNTIHRGVFVNHHVLCAPLPPAPAAFELPDVITGQTNRERIESATAACGGACHQVFINPAGYAFEHYDALGVYQRVEAGQPVDASSAFRMRAGLTPFKDAVEFSQIMAKSIDAHECHARHLVEYLYGRVPSQNDEPLVRRLGWRSLHEGLSVKDLIVEAVISPAFLSRTAQEVKP